MNARNKVVIPKSAQSNLYHSQDCSYDIDDRRSALLAEEDAKELGRRPHDCIIEPRRERVRAIWSRAGIHASFSDDGVYTELGPVSGEDVEEALSVVDHVLDQ